MDKPILNPKTGYIDYNAIFEIGVSIYMLLGQRSDGKTYGALYDSIDYYIKTGTPSAYIRRFDTSLRKANLMALCEPHKKTIKKWTRGKWDGVTYKSRRFYFTKADGEKQIVSNDPFLYCFSLNTWENDKGQDNGVFHNVIIDEYISSVKYLPNEYSIFENVLSSVLRNRDGARVIMLGNPINQICPYFDEFNIEPHKLKQGDIVYRINDNGDKLKFVYIPAMNEQLRKSNKFFTFGRNKSSISTGYWEFGEFPHVPSGLIKDSQCLGSFGIMYRGQFAICEYYYKNGVTFCFWRPANGDKLLNDTKIAIFADVHIFQPNIYLAWTHNFLTEFYEKCVRNNRQYFADNKTGNLVKMWYDDTMRKAGRF